MKKILVIHTQGEKMKNVAQGIAEGAKKNGHQVDILATDTEKLTVSFRPYDLVIAGSPTVGFFKGKVASDFSNVLRKCKRTVGQKAIAYVTPKAFATNKSLKKVMAELEKLGCVVTNFATLKNKREAVRFASNI